MTLEDDRTPWETEHKVDRDPVRDVIPFGVWFPVKCGDCKTELTEAYMANPVEIKGPAERSAHVRFLCSMCVDAHWAEVAAKYADQPVL